MICTELCLVDLVSHLGSLIKLFVLWDACRCGIATWSFREYTRRPDCGKCCICSWLSSIAGSDPLPKKKLYLAFPVAVQNMLVHVAWNILHEFGSVWGGCHGLGASDPLAISNLTFSKVHALSEPYMSMCHTGMGSLSETNVAFVHDVYAVRCPRDVVTAGVQEVEQPSGMEPWDCEAAFAASTQLHSVPIPDLAKLLQRPSDPGLANTMHNQPLMHTVKAANSGRDSEGAVLEGASPPNQHAHGADGDAQAAGEPKQRGPACAGGKEAVKSRHRHLVAMSEYIGALGCRVTPVPGEYLGTCVTGSVEVRSWSGIIAGDSLSAVVEACQADLLKGSRAWAIVLMHGFHRNPFCWKRRASDDKEMQRIPGIGVKLRGAGGTAGPGCESVGALVLLPGGTRCLICMSGEGDNFGRY
eukprot:jgi/Ulvmu1/6585/UM003_0222.1